MLLGILSNTIKVLVALLFQVTRLVWTREDVDICPYYSMSNTTDAQDTISILFKVTILSTQHISQYLKLHIIFITNPLLHKIL